MTDVRPGQDWPPWWERVGGRWAVSWQEAAISAPLGLLSVLLANAAQIRSAHDLLTWTLVGLFAVAVTAVWTLALALTLMRDRAVRPVGPTVVIGGALLAGALFGAAVSLAIDLLGLPSDRTTLQRIVLAAVFICWWAIAMSLVLDGRDRVRATREEVIGQAVALEITRMRQEAIIDEMRAQIADAVESALDEPRNRLDGLLVAHADDVSSTPWPRVASALRETAASSVRPLSQELWAAANREYERPRPWSVLAYVVDRQPFRPLAVSLLYVVSSGITNISAFGWGPGGVLTSLTVALIVAIMAVANASMRRWPQRHRTIYLVGLVVLEGLTVLVNPVRELIGVPALTPGALVGSVIAGIVIVLATSAFGAFRGMDLESIAAIEADIDAELVTSIARSRQLADLLHEAGGVVHGSVQARLLACAIAVEQSGRAQDPAQLATAIEQARVVLATPLQADGAAATTLAAEVARKCDLWRGLCVVESHVDETVAGVTGQTALDAGRVVEEAVANAVRHGDCGCVDVDVRAVEDRLRIVVADDGTGMADRSVTPGIGSALYATVSGGTWTLRPRSGRPGAELVVEMPLP